MQATSRDFRQLCDSLLEFGLVDRRQIAEAVDAIGSEDAAEIVDLMQRRGWLTSFQLRKIDRGDTSGYFFGPYKVQYLIAAGSFARVFRAVDPSGNAVAVKALRNRHCSEQSSIDQFYREAMLTKSLVHPNITRTIEVGIDRAAAQPYLVMEFIEGGNLREFINIRRKFDPAEVVRMGREMADGLRFALTRGATHRDIKPTNILLSSTGHVKWVDFGLAGNSEDAPGKNAPVTAQRTVDYAALEKATGAPRGDFRSDIFFLGVVWYEMLAGRAPLPKLNDNNSSMRQFHLKNIIALSSDRSVPKELAAIVDRMMEFEPAKRYQDYESILTDLSRLPFAAAPAPHATRTRQKGQTRVALIHRSQSVQEKIKESLRKRGMQVVLTSDLKRAMSIGELSPFDCMVIDLKTTGHEGVETFSRYVRKSTASKSACPAVFLAGDEDKKWTKSLPSGQVAVLSKEGLTLGKVCRAIEKLLKTRRK